MNEARRHHDMGGLGAGPVDRDGHDKAPWEKRVDALLVLLGQRKIVGVDELRRASRSSEPTPTTATATTSGGWRP